MRRGNQSGKAKETSSRERPKAVETSARQNAAGRPAARTSNATTSHARSACSNRGPAASLCGASATQGLQLLQAAGSTDATLGRAAACPLAARRPAPRAGILDVLPPAGTCRARDGMTVARRRDSGSESGGRLSRAAAPRSSHSAAASASGAADATDGSRDLWEKPASAGLEELQARRPIASAPVDPPGFAATTSPEDMAATRVFKAASSALRPSCWPQSRSISVPCASSATRKRSSARLASR
mmetsp:Transcript_10192/g.30617  ORF Transcript_10192/g.30617 Transcript_10192/m.30617 type:complete len:243 (-) Transcript_10192:99-827(-)